MNKLFWKTLRDNDVLIDLSIYPPCKNKVQEYIKLINENRIILGDLHYCDFFSCQNNFSGESDIKESFKHCGTSFCSTKKRANLWNSKLYTCPVCYTEYFNKYFNLNRPNPQGFDIYKLSGEELLSSLNNPIEYCKYCSPQNQKKFEWGKSEKKMEEWTTK